MNLYAIVLAGGSGTRLWPLSRRSRPKQLLALPGPTSMLQSTLDRLSGLVPPERTFLLTSRELVPSLRACATRVPADHVIGEPRPLGTAPAAALGAALVRSREPTAAMVLVPADHVIGPVSDFQAGLRDAVELAAAGYLVTFGVRPHCPATGYGYIERAARLPTSVEAYAVTRFVEKPDEAAARDFVARGTYLWNSGIFAWTTSALQEALQALLPGLASLADQLTVSLRGGTAEDGASVAELERLWSALPDEERTTIDYGIMERWPRTACLPVRFQWCDVGSWASVGNLYQADESGTVAIGDHVGLATRDCLIHSSAGRLVATVGVAELIIVDTPDALLVCHRDHAEAVKELVAALETAQRTDLL